MINKAKKKLRQLFKNRSNVYLNTIDEKIEQGLNENGFIEATNEVLSILGVSESIEKDVFKVRGVYEINSNFGFYYSR